MKDTPEMWDLIGAGLAVGGTGVWVLSAAARAGVLRMLLELFPRGTWNAVTWVLIPALLAAPIIVQGAAVAGLGRRRPRAWLRATAGAAAGSIVALAAIGALLLLGLRALPRGAEGWLVRTAPQALIIGFTGAIVAGWIIAAARVLRLPYAGWAAVPVGAAAIAVAWTRAHPTVIALSYVLDRPEANGFFAAVAVGGAVGSAWGARGGGRAAGAAGDGD
jgi:hypothetical protein